MMGSRRGWGFCLAALLVASSAGAEPTKQEKEKARELMAQGREQRDGKDLNAALKAFQGADAIMHVPTTAYEVAVTQQQLGQLLEARETILALQKVTPEGKEPPPFVEARGKADALLRDLNTQIPTITLKVTSSDPAVVPVVTIDDKPAAAGEEKQRVNPGQHTVVAKGGGVEAKETVQLLPSENKDVVLKLDVPKAAPPPPPPPPPEPKGGSLPTMSLVGFGVGAAGLVFGGVTGVLAISQEGDLADQCKDKRCPRTFEGDLDSAQTMATLSTVGFIVAGVGVAVGVIGLVMKPKSTITTGSLTTIRF